MKTKAKNARLQRRIVAWGHMIEQRNRFDMEKAKRMSSGGYRCPGSNKQN